MVDLKSWLLQPTTGAGIATLLGTLSGVLSGGMTWHQAIPLLVGGVMAILFPENTAIKSGSATVAKDLEDLLPLLISSFQHGVQHGAAATSARLVATTPISASAEAKQQA